MSSASFDQVNIAIGAEGRLGTFTINGVPLKGVLSFSVDAAADKQTEVTVKFVANVNLER